MYTTHDTLSEYEYVEKENNILDFTIQTTEGEAIVISVDITEPKQILAEGGTIATFESDVLGHLFYALDALENK